MHIARQATPIDRRKGGADPSHVDWEKPDDAGVRRIAAGAAQGREKVGGDGKRAAPGPCIWELQGQPVLPFDWYKWSAPVGGSVHAVVWNALIMAENSGQLAEGKRKCMHTVSGPRRCTVQFASRWGVTEGLLRAGQACTGSHRQSRQRKERAIRNGRSH